MTTAVGSRVPVRDTELFVTGTGTGTAVPVMHGGIGIDHTCFRPWLDDLGDVAELTFYDHRGNGRSARPPLDDVDHATWVADADALREQPGTSRSSCSATPTAASRRCATRSPTRSGSAPWSW
jgi:proline iminopeptidase